MNLVTDKWIPVVTRGGVYEMKSLHELFEQGREIYDFPVPAYQKISLLRLLICITHASLAGSLNTTKEWKVSENTIQGSVIGYLQKWKEAFEMYGEGTRFLQLSGITQTSSANDKTKLSFSLPTPDGGIVLCPVEKQVIINEPLSLLAYQMFSAGGLIGVVKFNNTTTLAKSKIIL